MTRLIRMTRGNNLENHGNTEVGAHNVATKDEICKPVCTCSRRPVENFTVQFVREKLKSNFIRIQWAPRNQFYYTEQMTGLMFGRHACHVACG